MQIGVLIPSFPRCSTRMIYICLVAHLQDTRTVQTLPYPQYVTTYHLIKRERWHGGPCLSLTEWCNYSEGSLWMGGHNTETIGTSRHLAYTSRKLIKHLFKNKTEFLMDFRQVDRWLILQTSKNNIFWLFKCVTHLIPKFHQTTRW